MEPDRLAVDGVQIVIINDLQKLIKFYDILTSFYDREGKKVQILNASGQEYTVTERRAWIIHLSNTKTSLSPILVDKDAK